MNEFIAIPGFEGYYEMNILGEVYGVERWINSVRGSRTLLPRRKLKPRRNSDGYLCVSLCRDGKDTGFKIHVLIAKMFIPNPNNHPVVRHLNDIESDNRIENLAWGTFSDNAKDCVRNGTHKCTRGAAHHWFGKHMTPKNKGKCGIEANNTKVILDLNSGVFYYGTDDAAKAKNINPGTLRCKLSGHQKNNTGLIYA